MTYLGSYSGSTLSGCRFCIYPASVTCPFLVRVGIHTACKWYSILQYEILPDVSFYWLANLNCIQEFQVLNLTSETRSFEWSSVISDKSWWSSLKQATVSVSSSFNSQSTFVTTRQTFWSHVVRFFWPVPICVHFLLFPVTVSEACPVRYTTKVTSQVPTP
jgi:hypothetical protein